jgi:hypothetical protein
MMLLTQFLRTLVGLALLRGLRRGELFALRWWDIDEPTRSLQVRTAVYEGVFDDPKTIASLRTIPFAQCCAAIAGGVEGSSTARRGSPPIASDPNCSELFRNRKTVWS